MRANSENYDVAVVGAGPVGSCAAAAFARRGARVILVEANPNAANRFAGEWIHPPGVAVLRQLGLLPEAAIAGHPAGRGFVVFPDDGSSPILLPYADGAWAVSGEHGEMVMQIRARVAELTGVTYLEHARVTEIRPNRLVVRTKSGPRQIAVNTIVGADGRSSVVRKHLRSAKDAHLISHMAGVELRDVDLPFEGFGHVMLGGPGPVLLYRIGRGRARMCLDVPVGYPGAQREASFLWDAFAPAFPEPIREAFRRALREEPVQWAANRFQPRAFYGQPGRCLVGDAVGFFHPLTAAGITVGLRDAAAVARSSDFESFQRERESDTYVPELLANALYQVFAREDDSATAIRQAVFRIWRESEAERRRTMRILAGDETQLREFGQAFVHMAGGAIRDCLESTGFDRLSALPADLLRFGEWAQWPAASLLPVQLRSRYRHRSTPTRVIPAWSSQHPPSESSPEVSDRIEVTAELDHIVSARVRQIAGQALDGSVESAALVLRLVARALPTHEKISVLADQVSIDLDRATRRAPLADTGAIADGIAALASLEQEGSLLRSSSMVDLLIARLDREEAQCLELVEAVAILQRHYPGLSSDFSDRIADLRDALLSETVNANVSASDLARSVRLMIATGTPTFHPKVRQAVRLLIDAEPIGCLASIEVVATLIAARAPQWYRIESLIRMIESDFPEHPETAARAALVYLEVADALGRRMYRLAGRNRRGRSLSSDWEFCQQSLFDVSRTFARPIEMLPGDLRTAVTCGYLLCRTVDTIEDTAGLSTRRRDELYARFLDVIEHGEHAGGFARSFQGIDAPEAELVLIANFERVMRVFRTLPQTMQDKTVGWVAEMARGMQLYSHRTVGEDSFTALTTHEDLERYCYFVAGTVGHMLTDLFLDWMPDLTTAESLGLRTHAEAFGVGLQLTNILKDVTDDRERQWSFIPRTVCAQRGLTIGDLTDEKNREMAHAAVAPIFDVARDRLSRALDYTLSIPAQHREVRLFCLLPLWMAARTLLLARGNDAMFTPGEPVKIARTEVESLIAECVARVGDDAYLRDRYDHLWTLPVEAPRLSESNIN